ncbi:glycosyltransferase family 4 protein [Hymenobacter seoulensis]
MSKFKDKRMRLAYVVSGVDRMISLELTIDALLSHGVDVYVVIIQPASDNFEKYLLKKNVNYEVIDYADKKIKWLSIILHICQYLKKYHVDIVHCHFLLAGILGLTASYIAGIRTRIYTRHHGAEHHISGGYGIQLDKITNALSTHIVSISSVVRNILIDREGVNSKKIINIPHGLNLSLYDNISKERLELLRLKYNIGLNYYPIIGVVSRYDKLKGIQHTIGAFHEVLIEYPNSHLILANARGSYTNVIKKLLKDLPKNSYTEIEYEYDSVALYKIFDIFVHVPESYEYESFGLVYIEALASRIPSIFTLSGIANEFIKSDKNALVVPYSDEHAIALSVKRIIRDTSLANNIVLQGYNDVHELFQFDDYFIKLKQLYLNHV